MDIFKQQFMQRVTREATNSNHIYPQMAAAEGALESGFGTSKLYIQDNNLFGMKLHSHNVYGVHALPTKEFLNGEWVTVTAQWEKYPSLADCFTDRMATLVRLRSTYAHYNAALLAATPEQYVTEVSKTWSTDPQRAVKVLSIYRDYLSVVGSSKAN